MKRSFVFFVLLVASTLISAIFFLRASASVIRQVNSAQSSGAPAATFTVSTTADDGAGSLRDAVVQANASPGADLIDFNLGTGTPTIKLGSSGFGPLPAISETVTIDGATGGADRIELDGSLTGAAANGLTITADNCIIRALVINRFSGHGIVIAGAGGNLLQNNFIGTDAAGSVMLGNTESGVRIDGSPNNSIGGTTASVRNIISGNGVNGVEILNAGATSNIIRGNFIGTDVTGTAAIPNASGGVLVLAGGSPTQIGGTAAGAGNLISGNGGFGVRIETGNNNRVEGNSIGTTADGVNALPNGSGVVLANIATNNLIGGAGARNIISGNAGDGVVITVASTGNQVLGNFIGTDVTGTAALGNSGHGVLIESDSSNNAVGGSGAGAGNVISANSGAGVQLSGASSNFVQGNLIGTDVTGLAPLGNGSGVRLLGGTADNLIGGVLAGAANTIAFNSSGVSATGGSQNGVLSNSIFSNANLGINLSDDPGITPNDPCDADGGANELQNFPDLTSAHSGGSTVIQGSLESTANMQFRVEFFSNAACDESGNGEGRIFIGSTVVTTDAACLAPINVILPVSVAARRCALQLRDVPVD